MLLESVFGAGAGFSPPGSGSVIGTHPLLSIRRSRITCAQILAWADEHRRRTGRWPTQRAGTVRGAGLSWAAVTQAMREGLRGLPGGDSLAALLARERGVQPASGRYHRKMLTEEDIVSWAEEHRARTGRWPSAASGVVAAAPEETWGAINQALLWGRRGLAGGSSLSRLLAASLEVSEAG